MSGIFPYTVRNTFWFWWNSGNFALGISIFIVGGAIKTSTENSRVNNKFLKLIQESTKSKDDNDEHRSG